MRAIPFAGSANNSQNIAEQALINGRRNSFNELISKINDIDTERVRKTFSHYVYDRHPVVSAVGQHENMLDLNRITENLFWWRT